jgi:Holliday junction resolvasome RuvABC endonuclease subunit
MVSVLALDCSTSVGFAYFSADGAAPKCGTWRAPAVWSAEDYGSRFAKFHNWLCDMLTTFAPDVLAFESPVLPRGSANFQTTEQTLRTLIGLVSVAELVANIREIRCFEVNVATAKKQLSGSGRADKDAMIVAATKRGFGVTDDHQADACAVALVVYSDLRARAAA